MLNKDQAILVLVDVQGHLAEMVDGAEALFQNIRHLLTGLYILEVPVIVTEQTPNKIGTTRREFRPMIPFHNPIEKSSFSCCGERIFMDHLKKTKRQQVILCGIETHICIYQTAMQLLQAGYEVHVVEDAVSSRNPANKTLALRRMENEGVKLTGVEMMLFELLGDAHAPQFKSILQIVK
jgi:nicotinamidase-related amidase